MASRSHRFQFVNAARRPSGEGEGWLFSFQKGFPAQKAACLLLAVLLAGCSLFRAASLPGTAQPQAAASLQAIGTGTPALTPAAFTLPAPKPTATVKPPQPAPPTRPAYRIDLVFDYTKHLATVQERIRYTNPASEPLSELDLVVEANLYPGTFSLQHLVLDGKPVANSSLDGHRLVLPLAQPLDPGQTAEIDLDYTLNLPKIPAPSSDRAPVVFGYSERQTNLVDWYPYVAVYRGGTGWLIYNAWLYGEHQVFEVSDFTVNLHLTGPASGLVVAASSQASAGSGASTYSLEAARTFALSISPSYITSTQIVDGVTVTGYAFPWDKAAGEKAVHDTAQAVALFSRLYGAYPHKSLSVVEANFLDGMEFDGLYFLSYGFYNLYDGTSKGYLTVIAAHETAHQWWYGLVGDDQAKEPWLDEAFATFNELVFYENNYPDLVDWWWSYRVNYYQPKGWINHPIYGYGGYTAYRNAVYLHGAEFLVDLRKQMGEQEFYTFVRALVTHYQGRIMTSAGFFDVLKTHTRQDLRPLISQYFDPAVK